MKRNEQPVFHFNQSLTDGQLRHFQKNGVIQFKSFINREQVSNLISEIEKVQRHLLQNGVTKVNGIPLKFGYDVDGSPLIQRIAFTSQHSKILGDFLKDERFQAIAKLLSPYEGRIGENEKDGMVVNHYVNSKESGFRQMGWHTDSPRDLFLGSKILPMLNVGIHLDDCPFENGGLRVLPGTHTQSLFKLFFRKKYYVNNNPDKREIGFDIEAGDLTVHDGRIWHRVEQSPYIGEKSRRRVIYIPVITGAYHPKNVNSPTPFYHKLWEWKKDVLNGKKKQKIIVSPENETVLTGGIKKIV